MRLPIYVINLDRRPDRLRAITDDLGRMGLEAERVPAVDAATVTSAALRERVNIDFQVRKMGRGSEANVLSHCRALETFLRTSSPAALQARVNSRLMSLMVWGLFSDRYSSRVLTES